MINSIAKKLAKWLAPHILPHVIQTLGSNVIELDKDKRYMLFLPEGQDAEELRRSFLPWKDQIDLIILLTDRFNLVEF